MKFPNESLVRYFPFRISIYYLVASFLWITLSDQVVALVVVEPNLLSLVQTLKGWFFVGVTAVLLYLLTNRHLTQRRQTEERLRESEQHFRLLFEANPQPMWTYDPTTLAFTSVNDAAVRHYGYARDEFLNMTLKDIRPLDDVPKLLEDVQEQSSESKSWRHIRKDGSEIVVDISAATITIGEEEMRLILATDVTERVEALNRATAAEQQYRALFEQSLDGIAIFDLDGQRMMSNNRLADMFGYDEAEKLNGLLFTLLGHDTEQTEATVDLLADHEYLSAFERQMKRENGEVFDAEVRLQVIWESPAEPLYVQALVRDITARKQVEKALRQSQGLLAEAEAIARMGSWAWDNENDTLQWSDQLFDLYGVSRDTFEPSYQKFLDFVHPDDRDYVEQTVDLAVANQDPYDLYYRIILHDGTERIIKSMGKTIVATEGRVAQMIGVDQDVTEAQLIAQRLQESEERYRGLINASPDIILVHAEGRIRFINPAGLELLGLPEDEVIGLSLDNLVDMDRQGTIIDPLLQSTQEKEAVRNLEIEVFLKDGRRFDAEVSSLPIVFEGIHAFQIVLRDITQRKQSERILRESEERFRVLSEANIAGTYIIQDNLVRYANPALLTMFGYEQDEVIDKLGPLDFIHPDEKPRITQKMQARLSGETNEVHYSTRGKRKNDTEFEVEVFGGLANYQGKPALIGTMLDITDRIRAESALQRSEANLRAIFDNSLQAFVLFDLDQKVQAVNRVGRLWGTAVLGRELEEGDSARELFADFDMDYFDVWFEQVLAGKTLSFEHQLTAGGHERWFEISTNPVWVGDEVQGIALSVLDISNRKESERVRSILSAANTALSESLDLDTVLEVLLDHSQQLVDYDTCSVVLPADEDHFDFRITHGIGIVNNYGPFRKDQFPEVQEILATHRSVIVADTEPLSHWGSDLVEMFRGWMGVPLLAGGKLIGLFTVEKLEPNYFTEEHVQLLEALAVHAAIAIQNAQLYEETQLYATTLEQRVEKRTAELEVEYKRRNALAAIELAISERQELDAMLKRTVDAVRDAISASVGCSVVLWDSEAGAFRISASNVSNQPLGQTAKRIRRQGGATRWIIDHGEPLTVRDTTTDPFGANPMMEEYGVRSYAGVPLLLGEDILGVLYVLHASTRDYLQDEVDLLQQFAHRIAVAVNRVYLYETLRETNQALEQASRQLAARNERITAILNSSVSGIMLVSLEHGIQQVNKVLMDMLNCHDAEACFGQALAELIHPDDRPVLEQALADVAKAPVQGLEIRVLRLDGSPFHAELGLALAAYPESDDFQVVCTLHDITRRKQAESELRQREQWYRSLVSHLPKTIVVLVDRDYRYLVVEGTTPGFQKELYEGKRLQDVHSPDEVEMLLPNYIDLFQGKQSRVDREIPGNGVRDVQYVPIITDEEEITTGLVVSRDVTEERRQQRIIRENEERLRILFENIPDGVLLIKTDGELVDVNPALASMLGYPRDMFLGKNLFDLLGLFNIDASRAEVDFDQLTQGTPIQTEYTVTHADGQEIELEFSTHLITLQEHPFILSMVRNVTERKRAEMAMAAALAKERELGELKSRFVSMASHEFRTPLATMLALVETLSAYRQRLSDEQIEQRLDKIRSQIEYLKTIMEDVLQLARIQAGALSYNPAPLDIEQLCRSVVDDLLDLPDMRHTINYKASSKISEIVMDMRLMQQVISNLLSNAIKYSPSDKPVNLELKQTEDAVIIQVQDHGIGIPDEDLDHLFEPFHRAKNVGTISGTGLGMVITKEAVELHSGTIQVESQVNVGTRVTISIPKLVGGGTVDDQDIAD